jgi:hypothetical protein
MWRVGIVSNDPLQHSELEGMRKEAMGVALYGHLNDGG